MNTTPISLLQRLRLDSQAEDWKRFADLYTPLLYFWARRLGLQEPDAADLVQDVFVRLVQKLPAFVYDGRKSFRSWLYTVLLNQCRSNRRRRGLGAPIPGQAALEDLPAPDSAADFGEAEYRHYLAQRALRLMQCQFQATTWQACWKQVVEGSSAAAVAADLGISEGAAYVAKCRVLRRLRQELDGLAE